MREYYDRFCEVINSTKLSPKTKADYRSQLKLLCEALDKDADWIITHCNAAFNYIETKSIHSQKSFINVILALFKHTAELKNTHKHSYDCWLKKFVAVKNTDNPSKIMVASWSEIEKKRDMIEPTMDSYFVLSVYTLLPPTLDLRCIKMYTEHPKSRKDNYLLIDENKMILCVKSKQLDIPKQLDEIIRTNIIKNPRRFLIVSPRNHKPYTNNHAYDTYIDRILHSIFGKTMNLRVLRNSYLHDTSQS